MTNSTENIFAKCIDRRSSQYEEFNFNEGQDLACSWVFTIIGVVAITGNSFALYFFTTLDRKWNGTKIIFFSMALCDCLVGFISVYIGKSYSKLRLHMMCMDAPHSLFECQFVGGFIEFIVKAGPFIFAFMCFTRCFAVMRPFTYRCWFGGRRCAFFILSCLVLPFFLAILPFLFKKKYVYMPLYGYCNYGLDRLFGEETLAWKASQILLNALPIFLPVLIVVPTSIIVSIKLLTKSKALTLQKERLKSQRQTAIMLIALSLIFFLTYLPFPIITMFDLTSVTFPYSWYTTLVPLLYISLFLSSAMNPFVYHLRGKNIFKDDTQSQSAHSQRNHLNGPHSQITNTYSLRSVRSETNRTCMKTEMSTASNSNTLQQASCASNTSNKSNSSDHTDIPQKPKRPDEMLSGSKRPGEVTFNVDKPLKSEIVFNSSPNRGLTVTDTQTTLV